MGSKRTLAFAIPITEENIKGIILSEGGPTYSVEAALQWFDEYGEGWFLRDENSALDCQFFVPEIFSTLYTFVSGMGDETTLIRYVRPKR